MTNHEYPEADRPTEKPPTQWRELAAPSVPHYRDPALDFRVERLKRRKRERRNRAKGRR